MQKLEDVKTLLENGANPNYKDEHGHTVLNRSLNRSGLEAYRVGGLNSSTRYEITEVLLATGADPNQRNNITGYTALMQAAESTLWDDEIGRDFGKSMISLLNAGADIDTIGDRGETTLNLMDKTI